MSLRPRYGALPPLVSGVLAAFDRSRLPVGTYASGIADFDLDLQRLDLAARAFALRGFFEWRISTVAAVVLQPGDTVFEGGAHYGTETFYYCALVGSKGTVVSFEADSSLAARLRREAERQEATQLVVTGAALGDKEGTALFELAAADSNSGLGSLSTGVDPHSGRVEVAVSTLDAAMAAHGRPRLVVMDIQGGELGALRGAERVLADARPVVVLEVESASLHRLGGSAEELLDLLRGSGYDCWRFTRFGLRPVERPEDDELGDWLALPREAPKSMLGDIRRALTVGALVPPRSRFSVLGRRAP
jgi:FkbM family methyltransferase